MRTVEVTDRDALKRHVAAHAFHYQAEDGRDDRLIVHSILGGLGADWDLVDVLRIIAEAESLAFDYDALLDHSLVVEWRERPAPGTRTAGRLLTYRFQVPPLADGQMAPRPPKPADPDLPCPHPEAGLVAFVDVARITGDGEPVAPDARCEAFMAEVKVKCAACGEQFRFSGVPTGYRFDRPGVDVAETTLHAPIRPASADPDFGTGLPGIALRMVDATPPAPEQLAALKGKVVALDFDGPLHSYARRGTGYVPEDPPTDGALGFVEALRAAGARLVVVSSRADCAAGVRGIEGWLERWGFGRIPVSHEKVAAVAYVDDRAVEHPAGASWGRTLRRCCELAGAVPDGEL